MADLFIGRSGSLRPGWRVVLFYVAVSMAYRLTLEGLPDAASRGARGGLLLAVLFLMTWGFLALERRPLASLGLRPGGRFLSQFLLGTGAGGMLIACSAMVARLLGGFQFSRAPGTGGFVLVQGALFYLLPALTEELTFRGYVFQRLEASLGPRATLVVTALLFSAAHLGNPCPDPWTRARSSLTILAAGLLLGLAYQGTRSLALPMGIHLGWNWAQGTLLGFGVSGTEAPSLLTPHLNGSESWLTGGAFGLEGGLPCLFFCVTACFFLLRYRPPLEPGRLDPVQ